MTNTDMTDTDQVEFRVLLALKVRGFATAEQVADSTGLDVGVVSSQLQRSTDAGLTRYREGRITGFSLVGAGRARFAELWPTAVTTEQKAGLSEAYDQFLEPNARFKQLTTDWQLRDGAVPEGFAGRFAVLHATAVEVVATAAEHAERFGRYRERFDAAYGRFHAGDEEALAKPMSESYHDVWMELHEDLIATLGRERTEDDG